jgi:hypothetical protein
VEGERAGKVKAKLKEQEKLVEHTSSPEDRVNVKLGVAT